MQKSTNHFLVTVSWVDVQARCVKKKMTAKVSSGKNYRIGQDRSPVTCLDRLPGRPTEYLALVNRGDTKAFGVINFEENSFIPVRSVLSNVVKMFLRYREYALLFHNDTQVEIVNELRTVCRINARVGPMSTAHGPYFQSPTLSQNKLILLDKTRTLKVYDLSMVDSLAAAPSSSTVPELEEFCSISEVVAFSLETKSRRLYYLKPSGQVWMHPRHFKLDQSDYLDSLSKAGTARIFLQLSVLCQWYFVLLAVKVHYYWLVLVDKKSKSVSLQKIMSDHRNLANLKAFAVDRRIFAFLALSAEVNRVFAVHRDKLVSVSSLKTQTKFLSNYEFWQHHVFVRGKTGYLMLLVSADSVIEFRISV